RSPPPAGPHADHELLPLLVVGISLYGCQKADLVEVLNNVHQGLICHRFSFPKSVSLLLYARISGASLGRVDSVREGWEQGVFHENCQRLWNAQGNEPEVVCVGRAMQSINSLTQGDLRSEFVAPGPPPALLSFGTMPVS